VPSTDREFALLLLAIVLGVALGRILFIDPAEANAVTERRPNTRTDPSDTKGSTAVSGRRPLPAGSASDPSFTITLAKKVNSTGTAFAASAAGHWLTARHVVYGCSDVALVRQSKRRPVRRNVHHANADLSLLAGEANPVGLSLGNNRLQTGQDGFHFGFPLGKEGAVHSKLLGRRRMRLRGRYRTAEPVIAWVEQKRMPAERARLVGMSGGPVLNRAGEVVGATLAVSARRGRIYSTDPATIRAFASEHGVEQVQSEESAQSVSADTLWQSWLALRDRGLVVKAVCRVD